MRAVCVGQFVPGDSPMHRIDPRTKLLGTLIYAMLLLIVRGWWGTAAFAAFTGVCLLSARVPFQPLWRGLAAVGGLLVCTVLLDALWGTRVSAGAGAPAWWAAHLPGLMMGVRNAAHLWLLVWQSTLMTVTTEAQDLIRAAETWLAPLGRLGLPTAECALMAGIALRFIPTLAEEAERILRAQAARGGGWESAGRRARWSILVASLVPLLVSVFRRADALALAMQARGYTGGGRSCRRKWQWSVRDGVAATMVAVLGACTALSIVLPAR